MRKKTMLFATPLVAIAGIVSCVGDNPTGTPTADSGVVQGTDSSTTLPDGNLPVVDGATPVEAGDASVKQTVIALFAGGAYEGGAAGLGNGDLTCAIVGPAGAVAGKVYCWGENQHGQLGTGAVSTDKNTPTLIPTDAAGAPFDDVVEVAIGGWHVCARKSDGKVFCWGQGQSGAIGDGTTDTTPPADAPPTTRPKLIATAITATSISAGYGHTCATDATNKVYCWGVNDTEQLGHPSASDTACVWLTGTGKCSGTPTQVTTASLFAQVAVGESLSCGRTTANQVSCWGSRWFAGEPTAGGVSSSPSPWVTSAGGTTPLANIAKVSVRSKTICGLTLAGKVFCGGFNAFGQTGSAGPSATYALEIAGLSNVRDIMVGEGFTCAVKNDGAAFCWGLNNYGQLGIDANDDGGVVFRSVPIQVRAAGGGTFADAKAIAGGFSHTCALKNDGTVWCWGRNQRGQLGDGTNTDRPLAVKVQGLPQ